MLSINAERLWSRLHEICGIENVSEGEIYSVTRQSFTDSYIRGAGILLGWMQQLGLRTWIDAAGNIYGRLEADSGLPCVLIGSHFDTVPNGGRFDGLAGVMAALEVVSSIIENRVRIRYPIEIIAFANEEACQFKGGMMGSSALVGKLPLDHPLVTFDSEGNRLYDAMLRFGADPDNLARAARKKEDILAFLELHIEQASLLEQKGYPIGIVSSIAGIYQFIVKISGRTAHAGAVPMNERKDALAAAAAIACEVERLSLQTGSPTRGTVGYIKSRPSEVNIIAGEAELSIDIREENEAVREDLYLSINRTIENICRDRGLEWEMRTIVDAPPVNCDKRLMDIHHLSADKLGIPHMELVSYAAHDSMILSTLWPVGMIFIRSAKGLSHCPEEYSSMDDIAAGTQVLLHSLLYISEHGLGEATLANR